MYLVIYVYTYVEMYITTINKRRVNEIEREKGGVYGRIWGVER